MTKTLTSALEEIKKRADRATPGPCEVVRFDHGSGAISYQVESGFGKNHVVLGSHNDLDNPKAKADATFDAMSRQDIPALLRVIEMAIESLEKYRNEDRWKDRHIQLGNGTFVTAPGLGMGPNIAREAITRIESLLTQAAEVKG